MLAAALGRLGQAPQLHVLNPKALPRQQLLGSLDLDTREWHDGVLTAAARQVRGCCAHAHACIRTLPRSSPLHLLQPPNCRVLAQRAWLACACDLAQVVAAPPGSRVWLVCDGDVDPEWVECLNSVLDDNRLLTLPNGERLRFGAGANLILECDSLAHASPATTSRWACACGGACCARRQHRASLAAMLVHPQSHAVDAAAAAAGAACCL